MTITRKHVVIFCAAVVVCAAVWLLWPSRPSAITFDSKAIAASETRMWQAYYRQDKQALFDELTALMLEQFAVTGITAKRVAYDLAMAAKDFASSRGGYEAQVLPSLVSAYTRIQKASGAEFDPEAAARAELDWWVARRTPGQNSVEEVGRGIAKLYAILYGATNDHIERAGFLRAKAGRVRDESSDWPEVQRLLEESYGELLQGIEGAQDP